jgi:hypothetical protein
MRWLCRLYGLTLWAYPPEFRRQYGREMTLAFRSRAQEIVRVKGVAALTPFILHITWDGIHSALREHNNMPTRMSFVRWIAAFPLAMLAAYGVMRAVGFAIVLGLGNPMDGPVGKDGLHRVVYRAVDTFHYIWISACIGCFSMAAVFVAVGVWVAPSRKESVARIAVTAVSAFGVSAIALGVLNRSVEPVWVGACILLGGVVAYVASAFRRTSEVRLKPDATL